MSVGLVCPYDLDVPGGVREQVLGLARTLLVDGHDVDVLAPRGRGAPRHEALAGVMVSNAGSAVALRTNGSTARLAISPAARARAAEWAHRDFDVVHVHEPLPPGIGHTVLRRLATRRERHGRGPAVVATVHVAMVAGPAGRSRRLRSAAGHVGSALRGVDVLTAVSEHARRTLVDHLGRVPLVVPNGVDVTGWAAVAECTPRAPAPTVVVLGRADEPRKGVDVLLRAWPLVRADVSDARLLVVGPSDGIRPAVPDGVRLLGTVTEDTKRALVASAHVLVAPHRGGESFGIVLVEAMAAGTPVVASDLPAFRDVLAGTGTLVPVNDPRALARAVTRALAGEGADRAREAAVRALGYDWHVLARAWQQVYELAVQVSGGYETAREQLRLVLRQRAETAMALAATAGPAPWGDSLRSAAGAAADPDDVRAQNRLTALVRAQVLPAAVQVPLAHRTALVRAVRALANDLARREGERTVELDDHVDAVGASQDSWP